MHGLWINPFLVLAVIPLLIMSVPFSLLEIALQFGVGRGAWFYISSLVFVLCGVLASAKILNLVLRFPRSDLSAGVRLLDVAASAIFLALIAYTFLHYHYVTPSASVLYYIFYDYARFFFDTGFYRPELPLENPSGTWLAMLTYNPAIGAAALSLFDGSGIEGFRRAFSTVTVTTHLGTMSWLGVLSRRLVGAYLPGVAIGFSIFCFYYEAAGLAQFTALIGSHDLPLFYFSTAATVTGILVLSLHKIMGRQCALVLVAFSIATITLGVSARPYLLSEALAMLFTFGWVIHQLFCHKKAVDDFELTKSNVKIISLLSIFIGAVGLYWFIVLISEYGTPVVYSHSVQMSEFSNFSGNIRSQLLLAYQILMNDSGGARFFSRVHEEISVWSLLIALFLLVFNRKSRPLLISLLVIYLLLMGLPVATQTGLHWKSFYPALLVQFLFLPLLVMLCVLQILTARLPRYKNLIVVALLVPLVALIKLPNILPTAENHQLFDNDQRFRVDAARLHDSVGGKILVLRGGEPGGDGQSLISNYYYWDNIFFFGDVDRDFQETTPTLQEFVCTLSSRGINMVFDPTKLPIANHSGQLAYERITDLLDKNVDIFKKAIRRKDGYKGVIYVTNYRGMTEGFC